MAWIPSFLARLDGDTALWTQIPGALRLHEIRVAYEITLFISHASDYLSLLSSEIAVVAFTKMDVGSNFVRFRLSLFTAST